jgi:hypothetical protein
VLIVSQQTSKKRGTIDAENATGQPGLLTLLVEKCGFRAIPELGLMRLGHTRHGASEDEAWLGVIQALVCEFRPGWSEETVQFDELNQVSRQRSFDALCEALSNEYFVLELIVAALREALHCIPPSLPANLSTIEQWHALEALLWRIHDGLHSIQLLAPHGLVAEVRVALRSCVEATLLFRCFTKDQTRVEKFRRNCLAQEVSDIEWFTSFNKKAFNRDWSPDILERYTLILVELNALRTLRTFNIESRKSEWRGEQPTRKNPGWRQMVDDQMLKEIYGEEEQYRGHHDVFTKGDRFAHTLYQTWDGWVKLEGERLSTIAAVQTEACLLPVDFFLLAKDVLSALRIVRPTLSDISPLMILAARLHIEKLKSAGLWPEL